MQKKLKEFSCNGVGTPLHTVRFCSYDSAVLLKLEEGVEAKIGNGTKNFLMVNL